MKRIFQYLGITFGFSWLMWGLQYLGQENILPEWFQIFGMFGLFGPFIAFLVMIKLEQKSFKETFKQLFSKSPWWIIIFAMISPMVLSGLAYIVYRNYAILTPEQISVTWLSIIPTALMILFVGGPIEEFGWRGYLLPNFRKKHNIFLTFLFIGIIHGLWHIPLHYLHGTVQEAIPIYEFLLMTLAITVSYVFIYEFTKSLIPMILLHWFANLSSAIFPYFYNQQGRYAILIFTIVLDIVLCIILYFKDKKEKEALI